MCGKIRGGGCVLGGIISSLLFRNNDGEEERVVEGVSFYNIGGEIGEKGDDVKGGG
ncbi:hypothetical protein [Staphylococcus warneri]|uniref:hypothetical protein n=1 Tax=Staphylococcus warneri TaxID=1292 RepID=UPI0016437A14|nr:hypothetical protein [Staphylococcus warneri]